VAGLCFVNFMPFQLLDFLIYGIGLVFLFAGAWLSGGLPAALLTVGGVLVGSEFLFMLRKR
jgi:hypothetical protein